jgi:succinoglycan biosynthesis protein ExoM
MARLSFQKVPAPTIRIIVVDNDSLASAESTVASVTVPWPVRYVVERRRGITYARNRAIDEAGSVDFVAFLDDDEVPSPQWLDELLWVKGEFAADVVSGPVLPKYEPEVTDWVKRGRFFERELPMNGVVRRTCATNNVLIGSHVLRHLAGFDHFFAFSGAEDTNYFLQVSQAGYKIVWSREAIVFETVSAARATAAWIVRREYQTGNGWVFCEARIDGSSGARILRLLKASAHVTAGLAATLWASLLCNRVALVRSLARVAMGMGMLSALTGHKMLAYKNPNTELATTVAA